MGVTDVMDLTSIFHKVYDIINIRARLCKGWGIQCLNRGSGRKSCQNMDYKATKS